MPAEPRIEHLLASVERDRALLARLASRVDAARASAPWPAGDATLYLVAMTLDHYYSAFEAIAERIARTFEGAPERGPRWHRELLDGAALALRDVRPRVIEPGTYDGLLRLLEFRHFVRHAYGVDLDPVRLLVLAVDLAPIHVAVSHDLDRFAASLRGSA